MGIHYIALHCITLHCITLHYITLHCITLHYITDQSHTGGAGALRANTVGPVAVGVAHHGPGVEGAVEPDVDQREVLAAAQDPDRAGPGAVAWWGRQVRQLR